MEWKIGDKVTFHVIGENLRDEPTGEEWDETGTIELIDEQPCNEDFCLMARVRVLQHRYYIIPLTKLKPATFQEVLVQTEPSAPILTLKVHKTKPKKLEQRTLFEEM